MKVKRGRKVGFTSVSIPTKLFDKVKDHLEGTGFPSVSGYVTFLLRMILSDKEINGKQNYETEMIKKRLEELGYSDGK